MLQQYNSRQPPLCMA